MGKHRNGAGGSSVIMQRMARSTCAGSGELRGRNFHSLKDGSIGSDAEDKCWCQVYCIKSTLLNRGHALVKQGIFYSCNK